MNTRPISRCRSAGRSDGAIGEHLLKLRVALVDPDIHAAFEPCVPALDTVHKGLGAQLGAAVAEVVEAQRLQGHTVGVALVGERLHDAVRANRTDRTTLARPSQDATPPAEGCR